jgi:hypothetical protein
MSSPRKENEEAAMRKPRSRRVLIGHRDRCQDFALGPPKFSRAAQHPYTTNTTNHTQRHHEDRDVLLLLFAGISVQGHNIRSATPTRSPCRAQKLIKTSSQRCQSLPLLQIQMPQELQDEAQPAQTRLDEVLPSRAWQGNDRRLHPHLRPAPQRSCALQPRPCPDDS